MDAAEPIIVIILLFVIGAFSYFVGEHRSELRFQNKTIEHNAAEWQIDPKTGDKEFVWLTCEEK